MISIEPAKTRKHTYLFSEGPPEIREEEVNHAVVNTCCG